MKRFPVRATLVLSLFSFACGRAEDPSGSGDTLRVPMTYVAAGEVHVDAVSWIRPDVAVTVEVNDARQNPTQIGVNTQEGSVHVEEATPGSTPQVVGAAFTKELQGLGLQIVPPGPSVQRTLRVTLLRLWVQEDNTYNAEVRFSVEVLGQGGVSFGSVLVAGTAKRFGSTLSEDNYNESWSSAFGDAMENLIEDATFAQAMSATAVPAPAAPVPTAPSAPAPAAASGTSPTPVMVTSPPPSQQ